jgi:hypothetical protein
MTFLDRGMRMSFGDIMFKFDVIFSFLWYPFPFQRGRKVFNGATTCNFYFPYFNSIREISPKNVNVKAENAPSSTKKKRKENRKKLLREAYSEK